MYSYGSPHMAAQKQDDQLERTFSSYVRIQDVVLKTYLGRLNDREEWRERVRDIRATQRDMMMMMIINYRIVLFSA